VETSVVHRSSNRRVVAVLIRDMTRRHSD
jgi:hypothetical protein